MRYQCSADFVMRTCRACGCGMREYPRYDIGPDFCCRKRCIKRRFKMSTTVKESP